MVDIMEAYVAGCRTKDTAGMSGSIDDAAANKINNWSKLLNDIPLEKTEQGHRRYMNSKPRKATDDALLSRVSSDVPDVDETYSVSHVLETKHFMTELRRRLESILAADRDEPLEYPLCEVGYSVRCPVRLKQHARHNSSNYIMNLTEAIFGAHRAEFGETFCICQHVISLIWDWDESQPEIAEVGFSKLAESFTDNAEGFSHYAAGLSTHLTNLVPENVWDDAKLFVMEDSRIRIGSTANLQTSKRSLSPLSKKLQTSRRRPLLLRRRNIGEQKKLWTMPERSSMIASILLQGQPQVSSSSKRRTISARLSPNFKRSQTKN